MKAHAAVVELAAVRINSHPLRGQGFMKRQNDRRCFRWAVRWAAGVLLLAANAAAADEDGRYRAVVLHEGGRTGQTGVFLPKVFIIDSRDGHMWTWEQKAKLPGAKSGFALGTILTYQGRVRPGKNMGEVVDQESEQ